LEVGTIIMKYLINEKRILSTQNWEERMAEITIEAFASNQDYNIVEIDENLITIPLSKNDFTNRVFDIEKYHNRVKQKHVADLRKLRIAECFSVVDRSKIWWDTLSEQQVNEIKDWYNEWLNIPNEQLSSLERLPLPIRPSFL
jgi:hypothetical protein